MRNKENGTVGSVVVVRENGTVKEGLLRRKERDKEKCGRMKRVEV